MKPILEVSNLSITFRVNEQKIYAVKNASFRIGEGELLCIVGESGSGKSVTALSIMQLFYGTTGKIEQGCIKLNGIELTNLKEKELRKYRGNEMAMVFQEPMTSLNPVVKVGRQLSRAVVLHQKVSKAEAKEISIEYIKKVGIKNAEKIYYAYPHEISGGMRQRIMIALAMINKPKLLICDEPTSALDVIVQAKIIHLIKNLCLQEKISVLFITHDMSVVAQIADRVAVMYWGMIVENGTVEDVFFKPRHPYTEGLIQSIARSDEQSEHMKCIKGSIPRPTELISGCIFADRCPYVKEICRKQLPKLEGDTHQFRCFYPLEGEKNVRANNIKN